MHHWQLVVRDSARAWFDELYWYEYSSKLYCQAQQIRKSLLYCRFRLRLRVRQHARKLSTSLLCRHLHFGAIDAWPFILIHVATCATHFKLYGAASQGGIRRGQPLSTSPHISVHPIDPLILNPQKMDGVSNTPHDVQHIPLSSGTPRSGLLSP